MDLNKPLANADSPLLPNLPVWMNRAAAEARGFLDAARADVAARIRSVDGGGGRRGADALQHLVHGFGWYATYTAVLEQVALWAERLAADSRFTETDALLAQLLFAEYAAQFRGGVSMSQSEVIRPGQLTSNPETLQRLDGPALCLFAGRSGDQPLMSSIGDRLIETQGQGLLESDGLDETMSLVRAQFFAFARAKVAPFAHAWHLADQLIPMSLIAELSEMGVFGLTIPEAYGGLGMGKIAMCIVSEELSRGWIGVGSLGTRSEIAAELIQTSGTTEQKLAWLPKIASGEILPTAVFTEPETGSDLGALRTRGRREGDIYRVNGAKTWITHAARADLMTLLVRTDPDSADYRGLSMLLAPKRRGDDETPFPSPGMSGGEIPVIGYRGMKEYEIAFDNFEVSADNLLGGVEGLGFKQLMATFESARIQTAARAIGVGQAALDLGLTYALDRKQFGRALIAFPRVVNKLALMAAELLGVRQLTYHAARRKDAGERCDLEAGMAKLIGARVAWAAADNALQIHGGNGFASEYPVSRLLADARILNIFEGAGEIQAQVIARRLLD